MRRRRSRRRRMRAKMVGVTHRAAELLSTTVSSFSASLAMGSRFSYSDRVSRQLGPPVWLAERLLDRPPPTRTASIMLASDQLPQGPHSHSRGQDD